MMSLILDALKRAQDDRQVNDQTSVTSELLQTKTSAVPGKFSYILLWMISLLLLAILISLWFLFNKTDDSAPQSIPPVVVPIATQQHDPQPPVIVSVSSQARVTPPAISDLYQQTHSSVPGVKDVQISQLYTENPSLTTIDVNESVSVSDPLPDTSQQLPEAMRVTTEIRRMEHVDDAITFEDLSLMQKQQFPNMNYSQHNYVGNSASSVVINGQLMRVGSRIIDNVKIVEILEDGIVLDFNGRRIVFKALNSWINM